MNSEASTTFQSMKDSLTKLLQEISEGKIQLPDFQRDWIWDDEHIKSILASVSLSYPIGSIMMLQTGNENVRFKQRFLEGVVLSKHLEPDGLILDGQQRLTALFQALYANKAVETRDARGKKMVRWYYIDIKALNANGEREEAIIGIPEDRKVRNFRGEVIGDYSTTELECAAGLFPLRLVFDAVGLMNWQMSYLGIDKDHNDEYFQRFTTLLKQIIQPIQQYQMPVILLGRETPKEAVCQVFEKVNTGGVSLTVFELLTATYAADNYNLRDDWSRHSKQLHKHKVLTSLENTDFLQTVTLLASYANKRAHPEAAVSCKRRDILRLSLEDYRQWAELATQGFEKAAKLLYEQTIFSARDLPYRTQLTPLAAIMALLGDLTMNYGVREKLVRWYWCGVFGELYGSTLETRFAKDVPEVLNWIRDKEGELPTTINEASFASNRLLTLQTRNSAAYKGLYALLLRYEALDFYSGTSINAQMYFDDRVDIHHIFPQGWCKKHKIDARRCDSVVNKTALSAKTNRMIGGNAPSVYLAHVQKKADINDQKMDAILCSHVIDPTCLRKDTFAEFFEIRETSLLNLIEKAMGKRVTRESLDEDVAADASSMNVYQDEEVE
ncbi:MAG: DUF262 domain-containing protein [Ktedonobacteraceae bacterium]|nr:DUF262 domain-containing protein [Ktedonobacteraceae bacterium]